MDRLGDLLKQTPADFWHYGLKFSCRRRCCGARPPPQDVSRNRLSGLDFNCVTRGCGTMAGATEDQVSLTPVPSPGRRGVRKGAVITGLICPSHSGRGATG